MNELILVQFVSAALFVLTGALVLYVTLGTPSRKTRRAAIASLGTAAGACTFMLLAYAGEKPLDLQRAGPILRHAAGGGERGVFEYADTDVDEAGEASGAGLLRKAMWGGADDSKRPGKVLKDCPHCPELVIVPAGFFRIGAAAGDPDATANERPGQTVRISRPFAIGRHEVTVGQYAAFLKATGGQVPACSGARDIGDPRLPVTCVSWRDAKAYTTWLSLTTEQAYRLPSEAEWEYAARAGSAQRFATGDSITDADAHVGRRDGKAQPVGSRPANGFGLYDVHGNAAEIAADCWVETPAKLPGNGAAKVSGSSCPLRALRDAHAGETAAAARLSARRPIGSDERHPGVGFRVMREIK